MAGVRNRVLVAGAVLMTAIALLPTPVLGADFMVQTNGCQATFPASADKKESAGSAALTTYAIRFEDTILVMGSALYPSDVFVNDSAIETELKGDVDGYVKAISATLTGRKRGVFSAVGGQRLQMVDYTYDSDKLKGRGFVLVSGPRVSCLFAAHAVKPSEKIAVIENFLTSVKIAPPQ
jgi:hypothetical protein